MVYQIIDPETNKWNTYVPNKKVIYIISHGFNGNTHILNKLGYKVYHIYIKEYDKYPENWQTQQWMNTKFRTKPYFNLESLVDNVVFYQINDLISRGEGPCAILTGSRGGQVTLSRLWNFWKGPSVCLNAGCIFNSITDTKNIPLGLITGSKDFFRTKNIEFTSNKFNKWKGPLYIYHNTEDDHTMKYYNEAIVYLLNKLLNKNIKLNFSKNAVVYE